MTKTTGRGTEQVNPKYPNLRYEGSDFKGGLTTKLYYRTGFTLDGKYRVRGTYAGTGDGIGSAGKSFKTEAEMIEAIERGIAYLVAKWTRKFPQYKAERVGPQV
jgi:hypothetical protein